jgi:hypothetical protein
LKNSERTSSLIILAPCHDCLRAGNLPRILAIQYGAIDKNGSDVPAEHRRLDDLRGIIVALELR